MSNGHEGILVNPGDHDALKAALQSLWENGRLRTSLGVAARKRAMDSYTDEAAGKVLGDVLREARHFHA
jgi:glycosyltransferase involved in cell wall biosynthesis